MQLFLMLPLKFSAVLIAYGTGRQSYAEALSYELLKQSMCTSFKPSILPAINLHIFPIFSPKHLNLKRKWLPYLIIILLAVVIWAARKWLVKDDNSAASTPTNTDRDGRINRDRGFDRRITFLEYSKHAKCRMECRNISQDEVKMIMKEGKVNYSKSDIKNARCPRYAVEGTTDDKQRVRIVYAQCDELTTVVTVIDLDTEWTCHCPGDDDKYKKRN
jgi:hypothetical protein